MFNNKNNMLYVLVILLDQTVTILHIYLHQILQEMEMFFSWIEMHISKWKGRNVYINLVRKRLRELNLHVKFSGFVVETEGNYRGYLGIKNWFYSKVIFERESLIRRKPQPGTNHLFQPSCPLLRPLIFCAYACFC